MARNANEFYVFGRKGKALVSSASFHCDKDSDRPFMESALCRFEMSLLTDGSALECNIPTKDLYGISMKTNEAIKLLMNSKNSGDVGATETEDFSASPAFSVTLMLTAFKGRTPGDILVEDPGKKDELLKGKSWLEANLAKFPANKKQIDAINAAINLLEIGELHSAPATSKPKSSIFTIYKKDCKYKNKKDSNGNNLVYSVTIACDTTKNFPIEISIENCYAPVISSGSGQTTVKMSAAVNKKVASMSVLEDEWLAWVGQANKLYDCFNNRAFPDLYKKVVDSGFFAKKTEAVSDSDYTNSDLPY
jgi:hypothetical protein